jgi:triacylglycerol lipase
VSHNEHDIIISCRGTERNLNDLMSDLDITLVNPAHGKGLVHRGFRNSVDRIWPKLSEYLKKIQASHDIWITGHSLGGGMANIIAMYLHASKELKNSTTLFTYGAPAAGDQVFVDYLTLMHVNHCRFVNNSDIVPRLLGGLYKHHSKMIFINSKGEVTGNNDLLMITSAWHLVKGLIKLSAGFIDDHNLSRYIDHLHKWAKTATKK